MLPPETQRVWDFVRGQRALGGFVLIGGSALSLRLGHRFSQDLDLAWPEARLPHSRLEAFLHAGSEAGLDFQAADDQLSLQQFFDSGLDL